MKAPNKQRVQKNCCAVLTVASRNFFKSLAPKRNKMQFLNSEFFNNVVILKGIVKKLDQTLLIALNRLRLWTSDGLL